jgi:hypothetical protein
MHGAMIAAEVAALAQDTDSFCFAETVGRILDAFTHDYRLTASDEFVQTAEAGAANVLPPTAVEWFRGLGHLVAPLCFLVESDTDVYLLFRTMYTRFWRPLHTAPDRPDSHLELALATFRSGLNELIQRHDLGYALGNKAISFEEVDALALQWIVAGFSGYLPASQVLQVWDMVVATKSAAATLASVAAAVVAMRIAAVVDCDEVHEPMDWRLSFRDLSDVDIALLVEQWLVDLPEEQDEADASSSRFLGD